MFSRARTEALSDAVFAIALTLLVLELRPPAEGGFAAGLLDEWPTYIAYLTAFLTIAMIWINHHAVFARIAVVDAATVLLNFGLLLGASLVPWPTSLISAAVRSDVPGDRSAAIVVYAVVVVIVSVPWAVLNRRLAGRPRQLVDQGEAGWLRRNSVVAILAVLPAAAASALAFVSPIAALLLLLATLIASLAANLRSSAGAAPGVSPPARRGRR